MGLFGRRKHSGIGHDYRAAIAELRASRPTGYLTPEDYRAAELTRGRLTEAATASGDYARMEALRRSQARGLAGSPSSERDIARINDQTAYGRQQAGTSAEEQLYNIRMGRESYGQNVALAAFGAQTHLADREQQSRDAQTAAFWNSMSTVVGSIAGFAGGGAPGAGAKGAAPAAAGSGTASGSAYGYDPSGGVPGSNTYRVPQAY